MTPQSIPLSAAQLLFLSGQSLLSGTSGPVSQAKVLSKIEQLGLVQLDSINIVERAHHHILFTRLENYRPRHLAKLQAAGSIFEHWTHDASIIPAKWFPHWRHRFARASWGSSWLRQRLGPNPRPLLDAVINRIRDDGPLTAREFEQNGHKSGAWWDWKPAKAALEYWWRTGELAIPRRIRFEKVYDLTHRVLPEVHGLPTTSEQEHIEWACRGALERLGVATPRELAQFWNAISAAQAASWCKAAAKKGEIVPAFIEGQPQSPARLAYASPNWREQAQACEPGITGIRLLSPFDPLIRDRARASRLFNFDYRFEAFVPEPKRKYGYYVLPILESSEQGARLVGRLDPKFDRAAGALRIRRIWWENRVKPTQDRRRALNVALESYAAFIGANRIVFDAAGS